MSLLERCISDPASLYALNDAVATRIAAENPHVDERLAWRLRCWNLLLWRCPRVPPCMAVLIFFWLAEVHEGVRIMVASSLPGSDPWLPQMGTLFRFTGALITDISSRNITERSAPRRAVEFYAVLAYVVRQQHFGMAAVVPANVSEKLSKPTKDALLAEWRARRAEKGARTSDELSTSSMYDNEDDGSDSDSDSDDAAPDPDPDAMVP